MAQNPNELTFLEHLEVLRWHIIRSVIAILVFGIIAFVNGDFIYDVLITGPAKPDFITFKLLCAAGKSISNSDILCIDELPYEVINRKVTGQFTMHIAASFVIGLICAFPYAFWEVWRFIKPGLYSNERNAARGGVFFVSLLFIIGISFGYFVIAPLSINFLSNYQFGNSVNNQWDISSIVSVVSMVVLSCGLMFQLPVVVYTLSKAGIVTPKLMRTYRRHSVVVILVISAILTPPDVISQVLISLPLLLLYQISIYISARVHRRLQKKLKQLNT